MNENEIENLKDKIETLETKVNNLVLDITYMKAIDISRARQLEDSALNRTLLNDIIKTMSDSPLFSKIQLSDSTTEIIKSLVAVNKLDEIVQYLRENKKINAIKTVREVTYLGLKEAKDFIDSFVINV